MKTPAPLRFLQHVLLVDDRALPSSADASIEILDPEDSAITDLRDDGIVDSQEAAEDLTSPHEVDAPAILEVLADAGIACSIVTPRGQGDCDTERVLKLARISDLVVFDWAYVSVGSQGVRVDDASKLVAAVISDDAEAGGRLRVIVIYTQDDNIDKICSDLKRVLETHTKDTVESTRNTLRTSNVAVTIVGKPGNQSEAVAIKTGAQLAAWLPEHFAANYPGILPALALEATAAVRRHAYRILHRFPSSLDAAFISQAVTVGPEDASALVRELLADEMAAALAATAEVETSLDRSRGNRIDELLDHEGKHLWFKKHEKDPVEVEREHAVKILNGLEAVPRSVHTVTSLGCGGAHIEGEMGVADATRASDYAFAGLTLFRRTALEDAVGLPDVRLELGVVLEDPGHSDRYLLCVQPLCDSARVMGPTRFPFLPLSPGVVDLLVPTNDGWRAVKVKSKLAELDHVPFLAKTEGSPVYSTWNAGLGRRIFLDANDVSWLYVGTLRPEQAARQAERMGADASRIGLDESEWMRKARGA